MPEELKKLAW